MGKHSANATAMMCYWSHPSNTVKPPFGSVVVDLLLHTVSVTACEHMCTGCCFASCTTSFKVKDVCNWGSIRDLCKNNNKNNYCEMSIKHNRERNYYVSDEWYYVKKNKTCMTVDVPDFGGFISTATTAFVVTAFAKGLFSPQDFPLFRIIPEYFPRLLEAPLLHFCLKLLIYRCTCLLFPI